MTGRWLMQSIQMTFAIMPAAIYWFGGLAVHNEGPTASYAVVGTLVAFTTLQTRLFAPIGSLLSISVDVQSSLALFDRIFEYLDLPVDIAPGTRTLEHVRGDVRIDDVWFRYGDGPVRARGDRRRRSRREPRRRSSARPAPARRRSATSSRASTTRRKGRITIDGVDIRDLTFESLAANVGVVSQETYLFHATVRENLRFAKPDATDEEIEEAARAAQVHDLIASLPDGYETVVGERGYRFSGGEKQRMAIARAVLRNPPILVLDEATSALDTQTERAVQEALAPARRRAHDDRDRPPALDHPRCGPDRRPRPRPRRRDRHLRRATRARRPLRGARGARLRLVRRVRRRAVELRRARLGQPGSDSGTSCRSSSRCRSGRSTTQVSCPDSWSVPFTLKTMFSRFFGALTWTVQWMTFPLEGRTQLTLPTVVPGRFFFAHAVNDAFIVLFAY